MWKQNISAYLCLDGQNYVDTTPNSDRYSVTIRGNAA